MSSPPTGRMPRQIPFIIANEGCERFSFYGMRNILTTFLAGAFFAHLSGDAAQGEAKDIFHVFVIGVYFFPLIGGWLADRYFGKYRTILWVSVLYVIGHACLAIFEHEPNGFYLGLLLIAIGSGGIKPLVSTFMGDQFDQTNKHLGKVAFDAFYWIINFGSFFASLLMPRLLRGDGPARWWGLTPASVAFGVPGILMAVALVAFWLGRKRYVRVPPAPDDPHAFAKVIRSALRGAGGAVPRAQVVGAGGAPTGNVGTVLALVGIVGAAAALVGWPLGTSFGGKDIVMALCLALVLGLTGIGVGAWLQLDRARGAHPDEAVDGVRSVLRVLVIFALVTPFWSLFDQKASTWVFQAGAMAKPGWFEPAMMQALNPALVILLIPLNNLVIFPALRRRGYDPAPLKKMGLGIALAGASWIVAGILQVVLDNRTLLASAWVPWPAALSTWRLGTDLSIVWQIVPYILLTAGEVLVSATGLEFAYSQAPKSMKGVIMSFWSLAVTIGNLWVLLVDKTLKRDAVIDGVAATGLSVTGFLMFFFALFAFAAAGMFVLVARRYRMVDNYRES
ncbi:MAG: MFS transporter [Myxococcales bacterium]|nr:MFS transporter [Myxococcales bacterium]